MTGDEIHISIEVDKEIVIDPISTSLKEKIFGKIRRSNEEIKELKPLENDIRKKK